MDQHPLTQGVLTQHGIGIGVVSRKIIHDRAIEVALRNGRQNHEVQPSDWEQAKRELSGGPEVDPETMLLEAIPETDRLVHLSNDDTTLSTESPLERENEEGRSVTEQLVEEGVLEAARDQSLAAAIEAKKNERSKS